MHRLIRYAFAFSAVCAMLPATAGIIHFSATLSGANEVPGNASAGTGTASVDFDDVANTLLIQTTFANLTGTTTASHIHCCTVVPGVGTAGVATVPPSFFGFPLGVTSGNYTGTLDLTLLSSYNAPFVAMHGGTAATAEADLVAGLRSGRTYFNIHTSVFPAGEIRGTLQAVPEPWTGSLTALGLVALGLSRRRRR